jgi:DNA-directed RNA polymerase specialized sigma24 family protein
MTGGRQRVALDSIVAAASAPSDDLVALDEALTLLAEEDPIKARLVELRFFAGLSVEDAARCLGISRATADRYWAYARAWLYEKVRAGENSKNR